MPAMPRPASHHRGAPFPILLAGALVALRGLMFEVEKGLAAAFDFFDRHRRKK